MKKGITIQIFSIFLISVSGLLSISIMTKYLESENLGIILKMLFIFSLHSLFDGLRASATYNIKNKIKSLKKYCNSGIYLGCISSCFVTVISTFFGFVDDFLITFIISLSYIFYIQCSMCWAGLDSMMIIGVPQLIRSISMTALFFFVTMLSINKVHIYIICLTFPLIFILTFICSRKLVLNLYKNDYPTKKTTDKLDINSFLFTMFASIINLIERLSLGVFTTNVNYAIYSAQYEFAYRGNLIGGNVGMLLYPILLKKKYRNSLNLCIKIHVILTILLLSILFIISLNKDIFYTVFFNEEIKKYFYIFYAIFFSVIMNLFGHIFIPYQRSFGDFKTSLICYFLTFIFSVPLSIYLVWKYELLGASIAVVLLRSGDFMNYLLIVYKNIQKIKISYIIFLSLSIINLIIGFYYCVNDKDFEIYLLFSLVLLALIYIQNPVVLDEDT